MNTLASTVSQKSLTKNFIIQSMERKKIGQIQERISRRRLVRNPTIQFIIINLHTKYDYSSFHSFTEIFDEKFHHSKYGKKENQTNTGKNKRRLVRNPTIQYIIINLYTKYEYSSFHSFTEIFDEKFHHSKYGKKENQTNTGKNKRRRLVSNPTIHYIIINLHTKYDYSSLHSFIEIFDEKFHHSKYGNKENWTNKGKNKQEKAGLQSHNTACHNQSVYQI